MKEYIIHNINMGVDRIIYHDEFEEPGKPKCIRTDNGPEFISEKLRIWCEANEIKHKFIQPGKPTQNSYVERSTGVTEGPYSTLTYSGTLKKFAS